MTQNTNTERDSMNATPIRVFVMNDMEWWAGACTPEEMLAYYMHETGVTREEALGDDDPNALPEPLTDEQMDKLRIAEVDENERPTGQRPTFREALDAMIAAGQEFPCLFASTEW